MGNIRALLGWEGMWTPVLKDNDERYCHESTAESISQGLDPSVWTKHRVQGRRDSTSRVCTQSHRITSPTLAIETPVRQNNDWLTKMIDA